VIWHFGSLGLVPYIKHTKLCGNKHTKQKHLTTQLLLSFFWA
jgi:hypothetical protein